VEARSRRAWPAGFRRRALLMAAFSCGVWVRGVNGVMDLVRNHDPISAMAQFHFDPATYAELMRVEVPAYGRLQQEVGLATVGLAVSSMLDLGIWTGETLAAVLVHHPGAHAVGVDENEAMLGAARRRLAGIPLEVRVADLCDELPAGPFDLVVSALAVHHVDGPDRPDLFARIARVLRTGGRFVLGDVVIPLDQVDAVVPVTDGHDRPSTLADQLHWLRGAGFVAATTWSERDLAVVRADRPI
jgi:tRNA (cmo5U34)-methyltransferase